MKQLKRGDVVIKDPNYIFPKSQYSVITRFNAEKELSHFIGIISDLIQEKRLKYPQNIILHFTGYMTVH